MNQIKVAHYPDFERARLTEAARAAHDAMGEDWHYSFQPSAHSNGFDDLPEGAKELLRRGIAAAYEVFALYP